MPNKMSYVMLLSTIIGILSGIFFPEKMLSLRWIDTLFIQLLTFIVTPLVFCVTVSAIISMGSVKRLKIIWLYTIVYVLISTSIAGCIGICLSNIFKPGADMSPDHILLYVTPTQLQTSSLSAYFSSHVSTLFPPGFRNDEANFQIFPLIIISIVFATACVSVGKSARPITLLFIGLRDVFSKIIVWLMYLMPIGLFVLLGSSIAEAYTKNALMQSVRGISVFIGIFAIGLLCQFLWQLAVIRYIVKRDPKKFLRNAVTPLLTAFATSNSLSALPMSLLFAKEENICKEVTDFVLPFASTINLAGTAMYEAIAALFFCQILGIKLSILSQVGVFFTAIFAGIGAGSIPEGGLITMAMVLRSVDVPTSAIGILLPFDRLLDRLRSAVNVWGDLACAMTIQHFVTKNSPSVTVSTEEVPQVIIN